MRERARLSLCVNLGRLRRGEAGRAGKLEQSRVLRVRRQGRKPWRVHKGRATWIRQKTGRRTHGDGTRRGIGVKTSC